MDDKLRGAVDNLRNGKDEIINLRGTAKNNALTIGGYTTYCIVLLACYFAEVLKKSRTVGYFAVFAALTVIPLLLMHIAYRRNRESENIKYILAIGYAFFYTFTIFTTVSPNAFTYGVLISLFIIIYGAEAFSTVCAAGLFVINAAHVIYLGVNGEIEAADMPDIEIRIGFTLLYAIFMVMATKTINKNNDAKMRQIASEKEAIQEMLGQIMEISENMTGNIHMVSEKMDMLEDSVSKTKLSMEEVSNGTNDTAESVQSQLMKTEEIQSFIEKVERVSGTINSDMEDTDNEVQLGKRKIDELIEQVRISDEASGKVSEEMDKLTTYAGQMQNIVELIDGITSQTSLLSLNASIEAARVGEAGKGFAVVASEISNLAEQTQNATVDITELIEDISAELNEVVNVVSYLMDNNKLQSVAATETASSFETIASHTENIRQQTGALTELVSELAGSNEAIVDSIQTISAATEEVTAHSSVTLECSEENSTIVDEVGNIINELQALAERLSALEK